MEREEKLEQIVCLYSIGRPTQFRYAVKSNEFWLGMYICISDFLKSAKKNGIEVEIGSRCECIYHYNEKKHLVLLLGDSVFDTFESYIKKSKLQLQSFDLTMRKENYLIRDELDRIKNTFRIGDSETGIIVCISDYPDYINTENNEVWIYLNNRETSAQTKYREVKRAVAAFNVSLKEGYGKDINRYFIIEDFLPDISQNALFHISCTIDIAESKLIVRDNEESVIQMLENFNREVQGTPHLRTKFKIIEKIGRTRVKIFRDNQ